MKICGLRDAGNLGAAIDAGARYVGFVFFEKSPRFVDLPAARALALGVPTGVAKVGLVVDADDARLDEIVEAVPLDLLQLHGGESPDRVAALRARYGLPVMKALGVADAEDLAPIADFASVADQILIDAKPPRRGEVPGGNGLTFDWRLIEGRRWAVPWMLSGGLHAGNLGEAVRRTGAVQVDLSSGVEASRGVKDAGLIRDFMALARDI